MSFADIHCHLLPGIDDGAPNWSVALEMARLAVAEGIDTIVATPHQLGLYLENTADRIHRIVAETQIRLNEAQIPLIVLPGADVRLREDLIQLVEQRQVLTAGDHFAHLLLEVPPELSLFPGTLLDRLRDLNITPILTHPERNHISASHLEFVRRWVSHGGLVQITAGSVTGQFGETARGFTRTLVREGLVQLVATDAHNVTRRPPQIREAAALLARWAGSAAAHAMTISNPRAVANGHPVSCPSPPPVVGRGLAGWCRRTAARLIPVGH